MSESRGTPRRVLLPSAIRQAARMGSEEFLLPLISILPLSRVPPRMRKLSIAPALGPSGRVGAPFASPSRKGRRERRPYLWASPSADDHLVLPAVFVCGYRPDTRPIRPAGGSAVNMLPPCGEFKQTKRNFA